MALSLAAVEAALHRIWIGESEARLRKEDAKKARELVGLLDEVRRRLPSNSKRPVTLIDAAAGKSYVGLLAAEFLLADRANATVVTLERDSRRVELSQAARQFVRTSASMECLAAEVGDLAAWPREATLAVSLHACGSASDDVIESAIETGARALLLVPCCTSREARALSRAVSLAERLGVPRAAPVRRRFVQSIVDAERTLRLEIAGYRVEVVEFVPPTVTPHNLLFRAVLKHDEGRAERARAELMRLFSESGELSQSLLG